MIKLFAILLTRKNKYGEEQPPKIIGQTTEESPTRQAKIAQKTNLGTMLGLFRGKGHTSITFDNGHVDFVEKEALK